MEQLLMTTVAVHLDHVAVLVDDAARSRRVAEILTRPCFGALERVSAHRGDRWTGHASASIAAIVSIVQDRKNRGASFDTKRGRELVASGEIESGTLVRGTAPFESHLVFPLVVEDVEAVVASLCDLADALDAVAGYMTVEPSYRLAQDAALGGGLAKQRVGLSDQRRRARRRRGWPGAQRESMLTGPEWGTFLGTGHLGQLDIEHLKRSNAFERVVAVSSKLVFLQLTADPADELTEGFDARLVRAREALAPIMMDVGDVSLE